MSALPADRWSAMVRVFRVPSILALVSLVGLVAALVGDGLLDLLSWVALGIPVVVIFLALVGRLPE